MSTKKSVQFVRRVPEWERQGIARHELPQVRVSDLEALLNLSRTAVWRLRQVPGFPKANALRRFDRALVEAFVATVTPTQLRRVREKMVVHGSTDQSAAKRREKNSVANVGIRASTRSKPTVQ